MKWRYEPARAVPHILIGDSQWPGGQWVDNPVHASWDIGTLSYACMLSLPGYSFAEHYHKTTGRELPQFTRPSRYQVTEYLRSYPQEVGIADAIHSGERVSGISRTRRGFFIESHGMTCKHLVLASGIFSELIATPPLLEPLLKLPSSSGQAASQDIPLLVVGSGFSAADVITSCPPGQRILHIYKWAPSTSPSPLRACHQQAYPEYAGVYRRMKKATKNALHDTNPRPLGKRPTMRRASTSAFDLSRDWATLYEGLPNTEILAVKVDGNTAIITLKTATGAILHRRVSRLEYVVGRRGSLRYLSKDLLAEVCGSLEVGEMAISGRTLRHKVLDDVEVARNIYVTGSLTGDSLIRFAYGSCTEAAGRIMDGPRSCGGMIQSDSEMIEGLRDVKVSDASTPPASNTSSPYSRPVSSSSASSTARIMCGLDGHHVSAGLRGRNEGSN